MVPSSMVHVWEVSSAVQPSTHEEEPSYEATSSVQTCGWIASCDVEGCTDTCIPNIQTYHHELEALFEIKSVTALKCAVVAGMVKQFGLFESARRMLRSESSSQVCNISEARSSHHCSCARCTVASLLFCLSVLRKELSESSNGMVASCRRKQQISPWRRSFHTVLLVSWLPLARKHMRQSVLSYMLDT